MISSYGLHWRAEKVFWGRPGVSGTLLGSATKFASSRAVDFREQRGIYSLYAEYDLVYIGQTGREGDRLFSRLKRHRRDHLSERWNRFSWFGTQRVNKSGNLSVDTVALHLETARALNVMEAIAIAISEPRLNLQRGRWSSSTQYFQKSDKQLVQANDADETEDDVRDS